MYNPQRYRIIPNPALVERLHGAIATLDHIRTVPAHPVSYDMFHGKLEESGDWVVLPIEMVESVLTVAAFMEIT